MKIQVQVKSVYGNVTIYPICKAASGFCTLLKQKTLTLRNLDDIKRLGYEVFHVVGEGDQAVQVPIAAVLKNS